MHTAVVALVALALSSSVSARLQRSKTQDTPAANTLPHIQWRSQPVRSAPMIMNFVGAANLAGPTHAAATELIGIGPITMAPFNGNFQNATIRFDGQVVPAVNHSWSPCEGSRVAQGVRNTVRMPFKKRAIVQRWGFANGAGSGDAVRIDMFLDGPYFRQCDDYGTYDDQPCGWATKLPVDRRDFKRSLLPSPSRLLSSPTMDLPLLEVLVS